MLKSGLKGIGATLLLVFVICLYLFIAVVLKNGYQFKLYRDSDFPFSIVTLIPPHRFYENDNQGIISTSPHFNKTEFPHIQVQTENFDDFISSFPKNDFYVNPNIDEDFIEYVQLVISKFPMLNDEVIPNFNNYVDYEKMDFNEFRLYDLNLEDENNFIHSSFILYKTKDEYATEDDILGGNLISLRNDFTNLEPEEYFKYWDSGKAKSIESDLFDYAFIVKTSYNIFNQLPMYTFVGFNKLSEPLKYYDVNKVPEVITEENKSSFEEVYNYEVFEVNSSLMLDSTNVSILFPNFRLSENDKKLIIDESELVEMIEQMKK